MAYFTSKPTPITTLPARVSLVSNSNFIAFGNTDTDNRAATNISLTVQNTGVRNEAAYITIREENNAVPYMLYATRDPNMVNSTTFYLDNNGAITAENIRVCMLKNQFMSSNFEITASPVWDGKAWKNGQTVRIVSKPESINTQVVIELPEKSDFAKLESDTVADSSSPTVAQQKIRVLLKVQTGWIPEDAVSKKITITEYETQNEHILEGSRSKVIVDLFTDDLTINTRQYYFLSPGVEETASNIVTRINRIPFFNVYFDVHIADDDSSVIVIEAKNQGVNHGFELRADPDFIQVVDSNMDEVLYRDLWTDYEIQLDMYKNTTLFLGESNNTKMGTYITTLSKSYRGANLWFDINTIAQNVYSDQFIASAGWCDAGTASDYRFVAKRFNGINNEIFYISDVFYTLTGYSRNLDKNDLDNYVYDTVRKNRISPLTKQPILTHTEGQTQYFNFILSDPAHSIPTDTASDKISVIYKLYSQSGTYIDQVSAYACDIKKLSVVNTLRLNLDTIIAKADNVGRVEVSLSHNGNEVSSALRFDILPPCLHKLNDFAFLNSLGGWSSFNFGGMEQTDFKTNAKTSYRTQTPGYKIHSRIESVYSKEVTEQFVAYTSPINAQTAEWIKEISTSIAVYELATKRYVIVDDLDVKYTSKDELFTLQMKYHYSDAYNASINMK